MTSRVRDTDKPIPVRSVRALEAYAPPVHLAPVDLVLSGNEGAQPPRSLLHWMSEQPVSVLRTYPKQATLERDLAQRLGVRPEQVMVTAGGDEAIDRLCRAFLEPGRRVVMPQPTFVMLPHYATLAGAEIDTISWPGGPYPVDTVLGAVTADTAMITVVTPNNPTGATATVDDLARLAEAAPHAVLLVDLAYVEYADDDLTSAALQFENAVVVRTISKAWGLAGLRVGYAVGAPRVLAAMRAAGGPFSIAGLSLALAAHALADGGEDKAAHIAAVRREREELQRLLQDLGQTALPSQGNFVLARCTDEVWLRDGLAGLGIAVRIFPGEEELAGAARITCPGNAEHFARLRAALRSVLAPQAILFDMDGVLADVSGSYRVAIVETAASFGVTVTADDIQSAKAEGNANNDWELSRRLIERGGGSASLEEVTARFEELYQGSAGAPGLWKNETLLPSRELLERWAARLPLAIVTGRPRHDCDRLLQEHAIGDLFQVAVCLEDAPLKPDPAPVRLALERLGVASAWMLGDTPDDVASARSAGVVPIGVVAPGEDRERAAETLLRAGASRVVAELSELDKVMP